MALPDDVTRFQLTFGPYTDASGEPVLVGTKGKIKPSVSPIRHTASGSVVIDSPIPVEIDEFGVASVELAHTAQAVLSPDAFTYSVTWDVASRRPSPGNKQISVLPTDGTVIDFDLLGESEDVVGVHVPSALSVNGQTGVVVLDAADVGAATPADLATGLATKVNTSTYTAGLAAKQDAATLAADTATHVTDGSALDVALRAAFGALPKVAATVTASGTAVLNKHNPADATTAAITLALPTGAAEGSQLSVEKLDASANAVSLTGDIRGVPATTVTLPWAHEALLLRADSSGSWWPVAGHKTKASLDAAYGFTGQYMTGLFAPGYYYGPPGGRSASTRSDGVLTAVPLVVGKQTGVDRLGCEVTTAAAASVMRLGIYSDTGTGLPGTLLIDGGTVDCSTTGAKEITISASLAPGRYWLAAVAQGGTPAVRTASTSTAVPSPAFDLASVTATLPPAGLFRSGVSGALPTTFSATATTTNPALVVVRAA